MELAKSSSLLDRPLRLRCLHARQNRHDGKCQSASTPQGCQPSVSNVSYLQKIRDRQLAAPLDSETLQSLVLNELKQKRHTATEGLLWLMRGLDFTAQALRQNQSAPTEELSVSFRAAYGSTLKPHHNFLVKPIFTAAMSATPYRKDFYAKVAKDQERGQMELEEWLAALENKVGILKEFMARKEVKW
jgi:hypothetical protein